MAKKLRVLVVDDFGAWRGVVSKIVGQHPQLSIAGEAADGLEAIRKVAELLPDLIFLDISLPELNGLEVASRVRDLSPDSKILMLSETRSAEIAEEAFRRGALGYVVKSGAAMELLPAVEAVLQGRRFVSAHLNGRVLEDSGTQEASAGSRGENEAVGLPSGNLEKRRRHEVQFYRDHAAYVDGMVQCAESVLRRGDPVVVIGTAPHRASVVQNLKSHGVDIDAEIARGRLHLLDALETLSKIMVHKKPNAVRCEQALSALLTNVAEKSKKKRPHIAFCGQCAPVLLSQGDTEGAIELEHMWDEITFAWGAETLCGYISSELPKENRSEVIARICAEHSRVHGLELCR